MKSLIYDIVGSKANEIADEQINNMEGKMTNMVDRNVSGIGDMVDRNVSGIGDMVDRNVSDIGGMVDRNVSDIGDMVDRNVSDIGDRVSISTETVQQGPSNLDPLNFTAIFLFFLSVVLGMNAGNFHYQKKYNIRNWLIAFASVSFIVSIILFIIYGVTKKDVKIINTVSSP